MFHAIDQGTYYFFRFQARNNLPGLEPVMQVGLGLGFWLLAVAVAVLACGLLLAQGRRRASWLAMSFLLLGLLLVRGLEIAMARPRPFDAQNLVGPENMSGSFPARPVFLGSLAWTLLILTILPGLPNRKWKTLLIVVGAVLVIWVIIAQLYFGLYFLTDILAGLAGGLGLAFLWRHLGQASEPPSAAGAT